MYEKILVYIGTFIFLGLIVFISFSKAPVTYRRLRTIGLPKRESKGNASWLHSKLLGRGGGQWWREKGNSTGHTNDWFEDYSSGSKKLIR